MKKKKKYLRGAKRKKIVIFLILFMKHTHTNTWAEEKKNFPKEVELLVVVRTDKQRSI